MIEYEDFKVMFKRLLIITIFVSIGSIVVFLPLKAYEWMLTGILISLFLLIGLVVSWIFYSILPDHYRHFEELDLELYQKTLGGAKQNESVARRVESYRKRRKNR
jgi:predicted ferric reductase